jgi:hypothetical protein
MVFSGGTTTITQWNDKSGNGNNGIATGSPALTQTGINGRQAVTAAVGTCFLGPISMSGPSLTCFAIATTNVTLPNIRNPRADQRLVSLANGANRDFDSTGGVIPLFNWDNTSMIGAFNNNLGNVNSNTIVTGTPFMAVSRFDGTTASLWFNGAPGSFPSSPSTNSFTITKYGIGNQANPTVEFWSGFIGEIILFNTALTASERQQVEGYLAAKWGLGMNLPTTHPYSSVVPILPTQIAGCRLWLDAADPAGTGIQPANGSTITQWVDKSGLGNNGTPNIVITWAASGLGVNLPAMSFTGRQWFTGNISITGNQFTAFIVLNMSSSSEQYPRILSLGAPGANAYANPLYIAMLVFDKALNRFTNYRNNIYPPSGGNITYGIPQLTSSWVDGTNSFVAINGRTPASVGSSGDFGVSSYAIGTDTNAGDATTQFSGFISEIIVFNIALSTTQRQQMEQYLGQKWGIGVTNTTVAPGRYLIPTNRNFYPTDIPGCALWLDGADRTSMVFSPGTSNVTTWRDKSGNGLNATQRSGKDAGVYSSTSNCINFTTAATGYDTSYPANPTSETMFVVANNASPSGNNNTVIGGGAGARSMSFGFSGLGGSSTGRHGYVSIRREWLASTLTGSYTSGQTAIVAGNVSGGSTFISTQGGTMSSGVALTGAFSNVNTVIGLDTNDSQIYFTGSVMEIIFYNNTVLSTSQRQQVEGYLAWKWGLVAPLATGHPGKLLPAFSTNFTPKSISGCQLWLDGADRNSMTFSSGSNVSSWNDKSGNVRNMSTTANFPVYTDTGVRFTGSTPTVLSNAAGYSATTALNCFVVYQSTLATTRQRVFRCSRIGNFNDATIDTTFIGSFGTTSTSNYQGELTYSTNTPSIISLVAYSAPSIAWAIDGSGSSVWSFSGAAAASGVTTFTVGGGQTDVYFTGFIMEIVMFDTFFTRSQQQQVEGYLAWKWGRQSTLPSTHAYAKFSP